MKNHQQPGPPDEGLLDVGGAASYLATSERHLRRLVSERRIGFVKVGHFVRFRRADLDTFVAEGHVDPVPIGSQALQNIRATGRRAS